MKTLFAVVALALTAPSSAFANDALATKAHDLAAATFKSNDFKVESKKVSSGLCGGAGPSYIIDVKVKQSKKAEQGGKIILKSTWTTVKTYGISAKELGGKSPRLMASDECME